MSSASKRFYHMKDFYFFRQAFLLFFYLWDKNKKFADFPFFTVDTQSPF